MNAYGADRLREDGGRLILSSPFPKGWRPRIEKAPGQPEFPGTAVLWDGEYYEVIAAAPLPQGMRYTLQPWAEHHMMRTTDRYDADREAHRTAEWRAGLARERRRKSAVGLAFLAGHLPAIVQERLESELGVLATRLTFMSLLSEWALIAGIAFYCGSRMIADHRLVVVPFLIATYLLVETTLRFLINWTQQRPIGSSAGTIGYIAYWLATGRPTESSPFASPRGEKVTIPDTPPDRELSDAMTMREPLATLLPVRDQLRLRERHGYDYHRAAPAVAGIVLFFASLGAITSTMNHAYVSLVLAIAIAAEQIVRLVAFRRGPAASVIGWVIRPLLRNLL